MVFACFSALLQLFVNKNGKATGFSPQKRRCLNAYKQNGK